MDSRPAYRLRVSTRYLAPPAEVWAQKFDPVAIMAEFPFWAPFRIGRPEEVTAALADGATRLRVPARFGPLPWEAVVRVLEPGLSFEEHGTSSLFALYHHTHHLQPISDGTHYLDDLWFTPAAGGERFAALVRRLFVARHRRAARVLPAEHYTVGHAVLRHVLEDEEFDPSRFAMPS